MGLLVTFDDEKYADIRASLRTVSRVVLQHWAFSAALAAPALCTALVAKDLMPQVTKSLVASYAVGYAFFELTAFCIERNWSRIPFVRFWTIAGPMNALQAVLCYFLSRRNPRGCAILSFLCLGARECILQMLFGSFKVGVYDVKHRIAAAVTRGCAYSSVVGLLCGLSFTIIHWARDGTEELPPVMLYLMCLAYLPILRSLLRLCIICWTGSARPAGTGSNEKCLPGVEPATSSCTLDVLVAFSDAAYALSVLLEIPYAFALFLVPSTDVFCFAAAFGTLLDVSFPYVLEALRPTSPPAGAADPRWAPTYSIERPAPFFAALTSSAFASNEPTESMHLKAHASTSQKSVAMSPRVSMLYDEYDRTLIGCHRASSASDATDGVFVFAIQERKLALTTHAVAATAATTIAIVLVSYLGCLRSHSHWTILGRICFFVLSRAAADALTCWTALRGAATRNITGALERAAAELLWEGPRLELASLGAWLNKSLITCCATFPAIAAAQAWHRW